MNIRKVIAFICWSFKIMINMPLSTIVLKFFIIKMLSAKIGQTYRHFVNDYSARCIVCLIRSSHFIKKSIWAIHINSFKVQHSLLLFLDSLRLGISLSSIRTLASLLGSLQIYQVVLSFLLSPRCSIITVTGELLWYPLSSYIILTLCT